MNEETKYKVLAALESDVPAKKVSETYDVPYAIVLRWNREFKEAKVNGDIDKLYNVERLVLEQAAMAVEIPIDLKSQTKGVIRGLTGLQRLDETTQDTAILINNRVQTLLLSCESVSELEVLTECICKLRNAFFNLKSTQVQIQQNFSSEKTVKEVFGDDF